MSSRAGPFGAYGNKTQELEGKGSVGSSLGGEGGENKP